MVDFAAYAHRNGWLIPTNGFDEPIRYRVADDVPPEYQMAVQAVIVVRDLDESRPTSRPSVPRNLGEIIRQSADTSAAEVAVGNNQPSSTDRMIHGHFTFSSLPGNRVRVGHFETQDFGEESYAELLAAHHHSAMNNHNDDDEEEEEEALQLPDLEDGEEEDEDGVNDVPMIVPVSNEEVHRSGGRRAMANLVGGWRNASQRRTIEIENEGRCRTCALKSTRLVTCSSKFCRLPSCENCVDVVGKRDPKDRRIVLCAQCVEHSVDFKGAPQKEKCLIRVEKKDGKIYLSIDED